MGVYTKNDVNKTELQRTFLYEILMSGILNMNKVIHKTDECIEQ